MNTYLLNEEFYQTNINLLNKHQPIKRKLIYLMIINILND